MYEPLVQTETVEPRHKKRIILIPVDGSEHSKKAIDFYVENLLRVGDHVVVVNVPEIPIMPAVPYPYGGNTDYYEEYKETVKRIDEESKECLRWYGTKLKDKCSFKLVKEPGRPGEVVVNNAKAESAKIIIMGSRGLSTLRRTFMGSVSEYVLHHAHVPTFIVPPALTENVQKTI